MDKTINNVKIRPFKKEDSRAVINIIFHSFKSKFHSSTSLSDEMLIKLLKESGFIENKPFEGYFVAEKNNEVTGVILLKWKGQNRIQSSRESGFIQLLNKYGFVNFVKLVFGLSILNNKVSNDECYIEHIAVSPKSRGIGIGTMLIKYGKKFAKNKPTINEYTLYVAAGNTSAIQLYQNLGFSIKSRKNSFVTQLLFNEKSWLYMGLTV